MFKSWWGFVLYGVAYFLLFLAGSVPNLSLYDHFSCRTARYGRGLCCQFMSVYPEKRFRWAHSAMAKGALPGSPQVPWGPCLPALKPQYSENIIKSHIMQAHICWIMMYYVQGWEEMRIVHIRSHKNAIRKPGHLAWCLPWAMSPFTFCNRATSDEIIFGSAIAPLATCGR